MTFAQVSAQIADLFFRGQLTDARWRELIEEAKQTPEVQANPGEIESFAVFRPFVPVKP